jgi:hypothetical protein
MLLSLLGTLPGVASTSCGCAVHAVLPLEAVPRSWDVSFGWNATAFCTKRRSAFQRCAVWTLGNAELNNVTVGANLPVHDASHKRWVTW